MHLTNSIPQMYNYRYYFFKILLYLEKIRIVIYFVTYTKHCTLHVEFLLIKICANNQLTDLF